MLCKFSPSNANTNKIASSDTPTLCPENLSIQIVYQNTGKEQVQMFVYALNVEPIFDLPNISRTANCQ